MYPSSIALGSIYLAQISFGYEISQELITRAYFKIKPQARKRLYNNFGYLITNPSHRQVAKDYREILKKIDYEVDWKRTTIFQEKQRISDFLRRKYSERN